MASAFSDNLCKWFHGRQVRRMQSLPLELRFNVCSGRCSHEVITWKNTVVVGMNVSTGVAMNGKWRWFWLLYLPILQRVQSLIFLSHVLFELPEIFPIITQPSPAKRRERCKLQVLHRHMTFPSHLPERAIFHNASVSTHIPGNAVDSQVILI